MIHCKSAEWGVRADGSPAGAGIDHHAPVPPRPFQGSPAGAGLRTTRGGSLAGIGELELVELEVRERAVVTITAGAILWGLSIP